MGGEMPADAGGVAVTGRQGCCAGWAKPCTYHEGFLDGVAETQLKVDEMADCARRALRNHEHISGEPDPGCSWCRLRELAEEAQR